MTSRTGKIRNERSRAFTLIELILVMAILLVVLAVAAPSLSHFFKGRTLDSEARRVLALTRYGRERAVAEGIPVVLWMDVRRGEYGLRQEAGYAEQDPKAVEFTMDKDLSIEVADLPVVTGQAALARQSRNTDATLPTIRFQPDGFIDEISPQTIKVHEGNGDTVWLSLSRNQLNYEIQTNRFVNNLR